MQWQRCLIDSTTGFAGFMQWAATLRRRMVSGTPNQSQCNQKVFPSLYKINDASVLKKLTEAIRKFIPSGVSKKVRNSFSTEDLRKAAILSLIHI